MQSKIKCIKHRIDTNYSKLVEKYGDKCELAIPIMQMIDILIKVEASDEIVSTYLNDIESSLIIIEEKIRNLDNAQEK